MLKNSIKLVILIILVLFLGNAKAQDRSSHLPSFLKKTYFGLNLGMINHPFSQAHLEPGFTFHSLEVPPLAVRLVLLGYQFNKNLSAQISYMRPVASFLWRGL